MIKFNAKKKTATLGDSFQIYLNPVEKTIVEVAHIVS